MNRGNLLLLPLLSYTGYGMLTATSIGFVNGIMGKTGYFFRTPKVGPGMELARTHYFRSIRLDKAAAVESSLAGLAIVLSALVFLRGVWFLGLILVGFGILTLKSLNLSRLLGDRRTGDNAFHDTERDVLLSQIPAAG